MRNYLIWKFVTTPIFVFMLSLLITGCAPSLEQPTASPVQPTRQLDAHNFIEYSFGGGEVGADWTELVISGDGHIAYQYTFPNNGLGPAELLSKEYQLSPAETETFFKSLVDEGLFDLKNVDFRGVDVPVTIIKASIDGHQLEVTIEGTPDESIHGKIREIIAKVHPEK